MPRPPHPYLQVSADPWRTCAGRGAQSLVGDVEGARCTVVVESAVILKRCVGGALSRYIWACSHTVEPRLRTLQTDLRYKVSTFVKVLREINRKLRLWPRKSCNTPILREANALSNMCTHIWAAYKAGDDLLSPDSGLQGQVVESQQRSGPLGATVAKVGATLSTELVSVAVSSSLPSWMKMDLEATSVSCSRVAALFAAIVPAP